MDEYFTKCDLAFFYLRLLLNKRRIFTDVSDGRLQFLIVEFLWIMCAFAGLSIYSKILLFKNFYKTKNGDFFIYKDLQSAITISPTFEVDDRNELMSLIEKHVKKKDKILFIDVGAHVGVYSVAVGTKFKRNKKIDIIAFEPNANNFHEDNTSLLIKNIRFNKISKFKLYKVGLGDKDTKRPNQFGFVTKKLDSILNQKVARKYDVVFIKIDIEGYEEEALRGARKFIASSKKMYLMIEDCVKVDIYKYLKKDFVFHKKKTPYNSFWIK